MNNLALILIILIIGWIFFTIHKPPIEILVPIETYIEPADTFTVAATVYHATAAQTNSEPNITAFGYRIDTTQVDKYRYIAISRDLEEYFSKGDTVIVSGTWVYDGMWIVADRMNERWNNKIDFLIQRGQYQDVFNNVKIVRK
jgi:3D (Asp-Asp-Asp) domain-containing protein